MIYLIGSGIGIWAIFDMFINGHYEPINIAFAIWGFIAAVYTISVMVRSWIEMKKDEIFDEIQRRCI